jgi:predicted esterase
MYGETDRERGRKVSKHGDIVATSCKILVNIAQPDGRRQQDSITVMYRGAMEARTIAARTHGRYLVRPPRESGPWPMLVGFHGYRETVGIHMATLESIPGTEGWLIVAVQGLHRFYTKGGDVVASWMTKEDRELAIADNVAYVADVVDAVRDEFTTSDARVFAGFSQGTAMAFRAAAHLRADALIVLAADVPPDIAASTTVPLPPVLYGRGRDDDLYTSERHARDVTTLERLGVAVESVTFDGGHHWTPEFLAAAGRTLGRVARRG